LARTEFLKGSKKRIPSVSPGFKWVSVNEPYIMKQVSNWTGNIKYALFSIPYEAEDVGKSGKFDTLKEAIKARNIEYEKIVKKYKLPKDYFKWSPAEKAWFRTSTGKVFSRADLIKEIKAGKTLTEIAREVYNKHKAYFDKLPSKTTSTGKRGFGEYPMTKTHEIRSALNVQISLKYSQRQDLEKLKENKKLQKILAQSQDIYDNIPREIKDFIDKNKAKYKKQKYSGAHALHEAVLDMLEKKYPGLLQVSEGSTKGGSIVVKGQRLIPLGIFKGDTLGGDYGHHLNLKRMVYKGLNIPFATQDFRKGKFKQSKGYNEAIKKLLPIAQEKGILPKTFISPAGKTVMHERHYIFVFYILLYFCL